MRREEFLQWVDQTFDIDCDKKQPELAAEQIKEILWQVRVRAKAENADRVAELEEKLADLLDASIRVVEISDRKHDAWDAAKAAIAKATASHRAALAANNLNQEAS